MFVVSWEVTEAMKYLIDLFKKNRVARYILVRMFSGFWMSLGVTKRRIVSPYLHTNMSMIFFLVSASAPTLAFVTSSNTLIKIMILVSYRTLF